MATWKDVRQIAMALPGVAEGTSYGNTAWKVDGKLFVWDRPLSNPDRKALGASAPTGEILGARTTDEGEKFALIESEPHIYFTTPHFTGYPAVLVRLEVIGKAELSELVTSSWLLRAPTRLRQEFEA